jgi:hypothetical protein
MRDAEEQRAVFEKESAIMRVMTGSSYRRRRTRAPRDPAEPEAVVSAMRSSQSTAW